MTESPNRQSPNLSLANPYIGPRTFTYEQRHLFFGREREARDLLARVVSERVLLFYAQSGAGKSSLLHTRLIPQLREEEGFAVLPVGRVGGELPAGVTGVENIYLFNLMASLDQSNVNPQRLARLRLSHFLAHLTSDDGERWYYAPPISAPDLDFELAQLTEDEATLAAYDEALEAALTELDDADTSAPTAAPVAAATDDMTNGEQRYVLIIDQFEEILTTHSQHRQDRETFFRQLNQAILDDPNLWVVLTLREDYVAPLDPYAHLMADKLRARFYMERMSVSAALAAIRQPAAVASHPFAEGAAEALVDNLRRVRVFGQSEEQLEQSVEPVQLQVVCYQIWERLYGLASPDRPSPAAANSAITLDDLTRLADQQGLATLVDQALGTYYEQALATVLQTAAAGTSPYAISERQLRDWFSTRLITANGTRSLVNLNPADETVAGLPQAVVARLADQYLVRADSRAGGVWYELVHDRFIEPVLASNRRWLTTYANPVTTAYAQWVLEKKPEQLLRDGALRTAEAYARRHPIELTPEEQEYLVASRRQWDAEQREAQQRRRRLIGGVVAAVVILALLVATLWQVNHNRRVRAEAALAQMNAARQDQIARSRQLAIRAANALAADNMAQALRFSIQAGQTYTTVEAFSAIRNALVSPVSIIQRFDHGAGVEAIAWDGQQQVVSVGEERVVLWNLAENMGVDAWAMPPAVAKAVSVTWNPTGTQVATGHQSGALVLWSLDGTYVIRAAHSGAVNTVAWHPTQNLILTGGADSMLRIWEPAGHTPLATWAMDAAVNQARWDAAGDRLLIAGADGTIRVWESITQSQGVTQSQAVTRSQILELPAYSFPLGTSDVQWHSGNEQFLSAGFVGFSSEGVITAAHLWEMNPERPMPIRTFGGHNSVIFRVAFSPTETRLATSSEGDIRIWEGRSGLLQNVLRHPTAVNEQPTAVNDLIWLSETRLLSAGGDGRILLWSFERVGELPLREEYTERVSVLQWLGLGDDLILSTAHDGQGHLWRATDGAIVMPIRHNALIDNAEIHPDGTQLLTTGADGTVGVWDLTTFEEITRLGPGSGRYLYARWNETEPPTVVMAGYRCINEPACPERNRYEIHLWRVEAIGPGRAPEPDLILVGHEDSIQTARWNRTDFVAPAGTRMATTGFDGTIRIWDVALDSPTAGRMVQTLRHGATLTGTLTGTVPLTSTQPTRSDITRWVHEAKWNDAGSALLSYSNNGTARLWQWDSRTEQFIGAPPLHHAGPVTWADWSNSEGQVVTVSEDGSGRIWDAQRGELLVELTGHTAAIRRAYWTSEAKTQLLTVSDDATAILWQIADGTLVNRFVGHGDQVSGARVDETADLLLTYSQDDTARLWRLSTGEPLAVLTGHTHDVAFADWNSDRTRFVTGGMDGIVRQYYRDMDDLLRAACQRVVHTTTTPTTAESASPGIGEDTVESFCAALN